MAFTSFWAEYPSDYRSHEVAQIRAAICAGECVSVVGLSGAGKSNLLGFLANRVGLEPPCPRTVLVDCNRLLEPSPAAFFYLVGQTLCKSLGFTVPPESSVGLSELEDTLAAALAEQPGLCLLLDRFDALGGPPGQAINGSLRALRDDHKYRLTYVTSTRRPLEPRSELAELFYAHTLWLGPLSASDARWSVRRYARRLGQEWPEAVVEALLWVTWGYPATLRAACEAVAAGAGPVLEELRSHPAVQRRLAEFWADEPGESELRNSGLFGQPLLEAGRPAAPPVPSSGEAELTAKEHLLLEYFRRHAGEVCEKDDLIRAVWPEDKVFVLGIRDDSLAQLIRRLRKKIEADPAAPTHIHTIPGRGYRYNP